MTNFVPRYYEIEQALRARIAKLEPHAPLPSDAQLCAEFGVSRMTARGAVQRLVHEGLVYRVPGRGTFVAEGGTHRSAAHVLSFSDEMRRRGRVPSSQVLEKRMRAATEEERERLNADAVVVLRRVRVADDEPIALETAIFPAPRVAPLLESDLEHTSLFETLARGGIVPTGGRAALAAEPATAEDARLLGIRKGEPLLVERRLIRDQDGAPVEWTESRYVGTRYGLDVDFDVELPQ
jgi:GntR family transcriptional regulator